MHNTHGLTRRQILLASATLAASSSGGGALLAGSPSSPGSFQRGSTQNRVLAPAGATSERLGWFNDARFGLFIHWGPYSVAGVEASWPIMLPKLVRLIGPDQVISEADYVSLAERFNPQQFDPKAWVATAQQAGMRYIVITAKHHDGYCLFDAPGTNYKVTKGPYGADLLAQLADACADASMPLGLYYSPPDMHHPGYRDTSRPVVENWMGQPERSQWSGYLDTMEAQLRKLLTDYGEIAVVWFDGLFGHDHYDPQRFHHLIRKLQPGAVVNDRLGSEFADYVTPEQSVPTGVPVRLESPLPEVTATQFRAVMDMITSGNDPDGLAKILEAAARGRMPTEILPKQSRFQPWETCMTIGQTWAHDPLDRQLKSAETLIRTLVDVASRGGNLLLNVGPTPQGTLPPSAVERLRKVGEWLEINGDAIYGTTYGPVQGVEGVRSTHRRNAAGSRRDAGALDSEVHSGVQSGDRVYLARTTPATTPAGAPSETWTVTGAARLLLAGGNLSARLLGDASHVSVERHGAGDLRFSIDRAAATSANGIEIVELRVT